MYTKLENSNECYTIVESLPKYSIILFYIKSFAIGLWVLIKWLLFFLWNHLIKKKKTNIHNNYDGYHNRPPDILIDNKIGRQSYVKLKGVKFHFVEAGSYGNPLVILLHGFPDCWIGWNNQMKELARFFRVIALDLKGFNDSDKPAWRQGYSPKQICDELRQFIFSLGCNTATIIGHDLGGLIGWYFAHTNPENIERFICVSAPHPNLFWTNLHPKGIVNNSWLQFVQLPYLPEMEHTNPHTKFLQKYLTFVPINTNSRTVNRTELLKTSYQIIDKKPEMNNLMDIYKYVFNRRSDWTGPLNYYRNFPFYRIKDGSVVRCPVLIITGNCDNFCSLESIVKSTDYCNNPLVKIIEGADHWPQQKSSDEFNKIVLNFVVGNRANVEKTPNVDKNSKSFVGRVFGAVTSGVKIGSSVLDSVQQRTNDAIISSLY